MKQILYFISNIIRKIVWLFFFLLIPSLFILSVYWFEKTIEQKGLKPVVDRIWYGKEGKR